MNTHKGGLIHVVKYFTVHLWARELPNDLAYNKLLEKAKNHETAVADYHHETDP